jgi:hypothetical protein
MRAFISARKGLLVSDPHLLRLTRSQLWMEYMVERKSERSEREFYVKALRTTLIDILGLDLKERFEANRDNREANPDAYVPFILVGGNHHLMKAYLDGMQGEAEDKTGESKVADADYEEQAKRLMGDMEPIEGNPFASMSAADIINAKQAAALGIRDLDEFPIPSDHVIIEPG